MSTMARRLTLLIGLALVAGLPGCSTFYDLTGRTPLGSDPPHIYGGTRTIFSGGGFLEDFRRGGGDIVSGLPPEIGGIVALPVVADMVCSLVFDTLLLPITVPCELATPPRPARW